MSLINQKKFKTKNEVPKQVLFLDIKLFLHFKGLPGKKSNNLLDLV